MIDERALQNLVAHAGRDTAKRMIARFIELSPGWRRELSATADSARLATTAHEIVTSAGAVGLMEISREAEELEKLAARAEASGHAARARRLAGELERGEQALAEKMASL